MHLPDESQWDETTCKLAICQHPQCWATIRRIERGHPRILGTPRKTTIDDEDKLPMLTIVNVSDSCIRAKRLAHHHLSGFTFTKPPSLLSPGSKVPSKFQGRPQKDLPDKDVIGDTDRSPKVNHRLTKLSVLNLNETQLPSPQDVRNMVVIWIPEQPEKQMSPAEKKHVVPSQDWRKGRMKSTVKDSFLYEKQKTETQLGPLGMIVPPPSPVNFFEQLSTESIPSWNQFDIVPQDLLKDLLPNEGKTMPSLEMKTQLAMMKKKPPLEKSRPDSAISAKMFLSVHRLTLQFVPCPVSSRQSPGTRLVALGSQTVLVGWVPACEGYVLGKGSTFSRAFLLFYLQRPALRYPKHLNKFYYNLNTEGHKKQQWQQKQLQQKLKTPPRRQIQRVPVSLQEAKKKPKSDPESQDILHKCSGAVAYGPRYGHRTLLGRKSDKKQPQQMKSEGPTLRQDSKRRPQVEYSENYPDSFPDKDDPELSKTEPSKKDISAQKAVVLASQGRSPESLSDSTSRRSWRPELKLLRILQATDDEDEEDQLSGSQSAESFKTSQGSLTPD
nr:uncharacterized protein C9orf43 homolog isoform X2 [Nyctereutes procyonoides]